MKKKSATEPMHQLIYGKVPPQSKELEEALIGAILMEKTVFEKVSSIVQPASFYVDANKAIYTACCNLDKQFMPIDLMTVIEELKRMERLENIGIATIVAMTNRISTTVNAVFYAKLIQEKYVAREVIRIASQAVADAYEDGKDVIELLDDITSNLYKITKGLYQRDFKTPMTIASEALIELDNKLNRERGTLTGRPSGFTSLDNVTYGWQQTDFIVLAARPAIGKTAFALNLAYNLASHPSSKKGVAFFSLEMSTNQLVNRIISSISSVPLEKIVRGDLNVVEKKIVVDAIYAYAKIPIFIDDTAALTTLEFRSKMRRLVEEFGVGLGIIDYLQLMIPMDYSKGKNKNEQIGEISRDLKTIAKDLNVPIIALSQLSRSVETRGENKMPNLSDLRDSGAIEQDADLVMFLYIEDGVPKVRIAKHRNGTLATIKFSRDLSIQKFYNVSVEPYRPPVKLIEKSGGNFDDNIQEVEEEYNFKKKN